LILKKNVPGVIGLSNSGRHDYTDIRRAISLAQKSTASLGNFDNVYPDEPKIKRKPKLITSENEQKMNMKIVRTIIKKNKRKEGTIEMDKAVNQTITKEQQRKKRRTK